MTTENPQEILDSVQSTSHIADFEPKSIGGVIQKRANEHLITKSTIQKENVSSKEMSLRKEQQPYRKEDLKPNPRNPSNDYDEKDGGSN